MGIGSPDSRYSGEIGTEGMVKERASELDLRGLKCPLPALRTRKALRAMRPDDVILVHCTDPLAAIDIPHLLAQDGHELLGETREAGVLTFRIRKATG